MNTVTGSIKISKSDRPESLEQQDGTEHESNDAEPDHCERAMNEDELHRCQCMLGNLAFWGVIMGPSLACPLPNT